jgi:hypothetical protein
VRDEEKQAAGKILIETPHAKLNQWIRLCRWRPAVMQPRDEAFSSRQAEPGHGGFHESDSVDVLAIVTQSHGAW